MDEDFRYVKWEKVGNITYNEDSEDIHIKKVIDTVKSQKIKKKKFKVVLDSVNGAGSNITIELLKRLGCKIIPLYCDINGLFPRGAEPLQENLRDLSKKVILESADIG